MKNIDDLLIKYFEGETSLAEEKLLQEYFNSDLIAENHRIHQPLFRFFEHERDTIPASIMLKQKNRYVYSWIGLAASIFIVVGIFTLNISNTHEGGQLLVYVDGKEITNAQVINNEVLNSLNSFIEDDEEILNSQINILESFIEQ